MTGTIDINLVWGVILISITLKCWIGQIIIALSPKVATKIGIIEPESDVDPTFFVDICFDLIFYVISLWTLPFAGILLIFNNSWWAYFGLIGGGMYLYFVGRTIAAHLTMKRHGIYIGKSKKLKVRYLILTLWGFIAVITMIMAVATTTL
jgi:hypothetical protein